MSRLLVDSNVLLDVMGTDENWFQWSSSTLERCAEGNVMCINPVIYTRDSFRQKHHAGDPFLLEVCRREKIPVIPARGDSSRRDLDDELRAMVAERMAPTE